MLAAPILAIIRMGEAPRTLAGGRRRYARTRANNSEGKMIDIYSKAVLTVIAAALVALVLQNSFPGARAQMGSACGQARNPCYVASDSREPVFVAALDALRVLVTNR